MQEQFKEHRCPYLDDPFFRPVLTGAEALKAPIYLQPTQSPKALDDAWYGGAFSRWSAR